MDPHGGDGSANHPAPTIWPVGFAVGIACIFVGLILSMIVVAVGAAIAALFGFLWIRDVSRGYREGPEPARGAAAGSGPQGRARAVGAR